MKPYAIDKIVDPITDKVKLEHKPEEVGKPVTKETAASKTIIRTCCYISERYRDSL